VFDCFVGRHFRQHVPRRVAPNGDVLPGEDVLVKHAGESITQTINIIKIKDIATGQ
jgi:hypothetical protein